MPLKWVNIVIEVMNASNGKGVQKAAELTAKCCSIYETISKVADMNLESDFPES